VTTPGAVALGRLIEFFLLVLVAAEATQGLRVAAMMVVAPGRWAAILPPFRYIPGDSRLCACVSDRSISPRLSGGIGNVVLITNK
jgi:hypothetical protein